LMMSSRTLIGLILNPASSEWRQQANHQLPPLEIALSSCALSLIYFRSHMH
jgi:hypothetical protein